jgi:DNA adenine methylase
MVASSPLRYPGGKAVLSAFLADTVERNGIQDGIYVEPYAGGAGAAINLLFAERVQEIILNDADPCIAAFWNSALHRKDDLIGRIRDTPVSVEEWRRQRNIYLKHDRYSQIKVAFATFYLNRCNRSGIIVNGGPIGGYDQAGTWKIDARYNKIELIRRIEKLHLFRDRIRVYNMDAVTFLRRVVARLNSRRLLCFLDPPYYLHGPKLYLNSLCDRDHQKLAAYLTRELKCAWLLTYDNVPEINKLYRRLRPFPFKLPYTAYDRRVGSELLIHPATLNVCRQLLTN